MEKKEISFTVIMPTYNQCMYIRRAINSLFAQTYANWELIIVNDGCTDLTEDFIQDYLQDERVSYIKYTPNQGLGYALNQALDKAKNNYIAYLPSDDYYYEEHLQIIKERFKQSEDQILLYTNASSQIIDSYQYNKNHTIAGLFAGLGLQLVQVAHKKTVDRWIERSQWVTKDLFQMFWHKLTGYGSFLHIDQETCSWTIHLTQRHKQIDDKHNGGLNIYRSYYQVKEPLKMRVSAINFVNEEEIYQSFRAIYPVKEDALKILIVGELAYNPERIYALEQAGHKLYGLWIPKPNANFFTVGPLPFGHITDISREYWEEEIRQIKPDIIYGLLNYQAIEWTYLVAQKFPEIPLVWHFKEGPMVAQRYGTWDKLLSLYHLADGNIYLNPEIKEWYEQFVSPRGLSFVMDGDLPKADYFTDDFSPRLSETDGEIHTVAPGRLVGVGFKDLAILASRKVHVHLYVENYLEHKKGFIEGAFNATPDHFHLHTRCSPKEWVKEFSQYDAGWLHCFDSTNHGSLRKASWDDLNMPARMNTLAATGLPMIQKDNSKHIVAMQSHVKKRDIGIFFKSYEDLADQLYDNERLKQLQQNVLMSRMDFAFDTYVVPLIQFFREVIHYKKQSIKK
ncbi:glycosyltransferase [Bacteroides faecalis]|uniref:Glycosyltransferase 2-like domain-containing protein n=1 Tax=Bacteroides faecalis TaxID=2447885 RepID=A0A401LVG5_9BACE|nr:glycosyltransferase [Bacteroides faecalis]GCB35520.1 hypothetical protein KGMB02408_24650 [Bacteroides faecalis]